MKFPIFTIFLLFLAWFTYNRVRIEKRDKTMDDAFWKKEEDANATRRKDISLLPYVRIPLDKLPLNIRPEDSRLLHFEEEIQRLSQLKILNLTGMSNTELKLTYGAPNLTVLSEYDQNFTELARLMQQWGSYLYELCLTKEAECVLSHAVQWGSDIKGTYLILAGIYQEQGNQNALAQLKEQAGQLNSLRKENILTALENF